MKSIVWICFVSCFVVLWPLKIKAEESNNLLLRGKRLAALGTVKDLSQAIETLKELISQNPNSSSAFTEIADAQSLLASMYWQSQKQNMFGLLSDNLPSHEKIRSLYEEAFKWSQKAIELDPISADAHAVSALIQKNLSNSEEATRLAEKALILKPDALRVLRSHILLVPDEKKEEKRQSLISLYKEELVKDPQNARFHFELGSLYLAKKEQELARNEFELAIQHSPGFVYPYVYLGDCFPWYTNYLPWKKIVLYRTALKVSSDDHTLPWYYIIVTFINWVTSLAWFALLLLWWSSEGIEDFFENKLAFLVLSFLFFFCLPAVSISQYYGAQGIGSLLANTAKIGSFACFILWIFLMIRPFVITTYDGIRRHPIIYRVTESLTDPFEKIITNSEYSEHIALFLAFGEIVFLQNFFAKLSERLSQLGLGPWM